MSTNIKVIDAEVRVDALHVISGGLVDGRAVATDGTNQDTHIADATLHRVINDAGSSVTELFSASKIIAGLATKSGTSHTHVKADVTDLANATASTSGLIELATQAEVDAASDTTRAVTAATLGKGAANGVATLDGSSKIPTSQLPSLAITSVTVVADITARDALTVQEGDVAKVTDAGSGLPQTFMWDGDSTWISLEDGSDVTTVNGYTGTVVLHTGDLAENGNLYHTEARVNANANVAANVSHAADATKHRLINDNGVSNTELWSAYKIDSVKANCFDEDTTFGFFDDFCGPVLSSHWLVTVTASTAGFAQHIDVAGGVIRLESDDTTNDYAELTGSIKNVCINPDCRVKCRVRLNDLTTTRFDVGARLDDDNRFYFYYDSAGANWQCSNVNAGTATTTDSAVAADTNWVLLEINTTATDIKFYIDGTIAATHTTNLPTALMPLSARQTSLGAAVRNTDMDFFKVTGDRDGTGGGNGGGGGGNCSIC